MTSDRSPGDELLNFFKASIQAQYGDMLKVADFKLLIPCVHLRFWSFFMTICISSFILICVLPELCTDRNLSAEGTICRQTAACSRRTRGQRAYTAHEQINCMSKSLELYCVSCPPSLIHFNFIMRLSYHGKYDGSFLISRNIPGQAPGSLSKKRDLSERPLNLHSVQKQVKAADSSVLSEYHDETTLE